MSRVRTGLAVAAGAILITTLAGGTAAAMPASMPTSTASITIDYAHPAGRISGDFVGLSFEVRELGIGNIDPRKGNTAALFKTLGRSNVRFSGNTLDRDTLWVPAGQQPPDPLPEWVKNTLTQADIQRLDHFLRVTGWEAEVGINVGRWDPALAADQARAMFDILGDRLLAAECGNEPDQWVGKGFRPSGYAYADYLRDWQACADVVGNPRIAGPDTASPTSGWVSSLARDERDRLAMLMIHQYSMDPTGTVEKLLSPETNTAQRNAATPNLTVANELGLPMRIDETNSAWGGGIDGISNKHASALWALDYSMQMAQLGVAGINFHGGLGVCNEPIWNGKWQLYTPFCAANTADEAAQMYRAMPIYYGLWLGRQMGAGSFLPVTVSTDRNINAYAVRGQDGRTRIAIIHKEQTSAEPVQLDIQIGRWRGASVLSLNGTSLTSDDTSVQGATVDRRGHLNPRPSRVRDGNGDGVLSLDLSGGSAMVITLDR